jgi:hypothetical protein
VSQGPARREGANRHPQSTLPRGLERPPSGRIGACGTGTGPKANQRRCNTVGRRMPVLVDSGFRRGTDIVKALAMGATGVGIGRPCLWGLGAFGQAGVERVLELLPAETRVAMRQCGAASIKGLSPAMVRRT